LVRELADPGERITDNRHPRENLAPGLRRTKETLAPVWKPMSVTGFDRLSY
jgi:hypothetical protein